MRMVIRTINIINNMKYNTQENIERIEIMKILHKTIIMIILIISIFAAYKKSEAKLIKKYNKELASEGLFDFFDTKYGVTYSFRGEWLVAVDIDKKYLRKNKGKIVIRNEVIIDNTGGSVDSVDFTKKIYKGVKTIEIMKDSPIEMYAYNFPDLENIIFDKNHGMGFVYLDNCNSLKKLDVPEGILYIRATNCKNIKKITLPKYLTDGCCFRGCRNLEDITFLDGKKCVDEVEHILDDVPIDNYNLQRSFKGTKIVNKAIKQKKLAVNSQGIILDAGGASGNLIIDGKKYKAIYHGAFAENKKIKSITIKNISRIGERVFYKTDVEKVRLINVRRVDDTNFSTCGKLKYLYIKTDKKLHLYSEPYCEKKKRDALNFDSFILYLSNLKKLTLKSAEEIDWINCTADVDRIVDSREKNGYGKVQVNLIGKKLSKSIYKLNSTKYMKIKRKQVK